MKTKATVRGLALCATIVLALNAQAATVTKAATGTDLTDGASWGGTAPTATDTATWSGTSLGAGLTLGSAASWQGVAITGAASDIEITGSGPLTLGTGGIDMAKTTVNATLANPLDLGAAQSWKVATSRILSASGTLSGSAALSIGSAPPVATFPGYLSANSGAPTVVFPGVSLSSIVTAGGAMNGDWIGSTKATTTYYFTNNGTSATYQLQFYDGQYTKAAKVQLAQSGTDVTAYQVYAKYKGGNFLGQNFDTLTSDNTVTVGAGGYGVELSYAQTGSAPSGTVLLSGTNNFTGATTITSGTLRAGSASAFGVNSAVTLANSAGATLDLNGFNNSIGSLTGAGSLGGTVALGTATLTAGGDGTSPAAYAGTVTGVGGSLVKIGTGTLTLALSGGDFSSLVVSSGVVSTTNGNLGSNATVILGDANTGSANVQFTTAGSSVSRPITVSADGTGTAMIGGTGGGTNTMFGGTVTLNRPTTLTAGSTDRTSWYGKISGNVGTLTVAGGRRTVFESAIGLNDFVGDVIVTGTGTVFQIGAGTLNGENIPNSSNVTVEAGTILKLASNANSTETINGLSGSGTVRRHEGVGGAATLVVGAANGDGTFSGPLENGAGTLILVKAGTGTQTLTGVNTYSGATSVNGGVLKLGTGGSINNTTAITVAPGATFDASDTGYTLGTGKTLTAGDSAAGNDVTGAITSAGTVRPGGNGTLGTITGVTNLTLGGTLEWDRSANSTACDSIAINGTLAISPGFTLNPAAVGFPTGGIRTYTVVSGLTAPLAQGDIDNLPALPADYVWNTSDSAALRIDHSQAGSNLVWTGSSNANWDSTAANWTGPTGRYQPGDFCSFDDTATGTTVLEIPADVEPGGIQVSNTTAKDYTIASAGGFGIVGTTSLIKTGNGLLVLTSSNIYSGGTMLTAGVIAFADGGLSTAGPITMNGGTLRWHDTNTQNVSAAIAMIAGKTAIFDTNGNSVVFTAGLGNATDASLTKTGEGTLTLGGIATYTGTTEILRGTLIAGSNGAFGNSPILIGNGANDAALMLANRSDIGNNITVSASGTGKVTIGADNSGAGANASTYLGALTLNRPVTISGEVFADRVAFDGKITGNVGTLTISGGSRTTFLATTNDFVGDIVITGAGSILQASVATDSETIPNGSSVTVDAGALLQLAAFGGAETINALNGAGTVRTFPDAVYGSILAVGSAGGSGSFSGALVNGAGALSLTKIGDGTQTLSGINTYTGNTTVNAGTLDLAESGRLTFRISNTGTNTLTGTGAATVVLNGSFAINASAVTTGPGPWLLENVATLTGAYGATFKVVDPDGTPWTDIGSDKWTRALGSRYFTFDEATGTLTVEAFNFAAWAVINAPGQSMGMDHDNDGVSNGIEYFMGLSGNAFTATPVLDAARKVSWPKGAGYTGVYGTDYMVQTSSDLSGWTDVPAGEVTDGSPLEYTIPAGSPAKFTRLKVTGP
jgi:autotransporter-associated beta strand protein